MWQFYLYYGYYIEIGKKGESLYDLPTINVSSLNARKNPDIISTLFNHNVYNSITYKMKEKQTVTIVYLPEVDGVPVTYTNTIEKVKEFINRKNMDKRDYFAFNGQPILL